MVKGMNNQQALTLLHLGLAVKPVGWDNTYFKLSHSGKLLGMYRVQTGLPYNHITLSEFEGSLFKMEYEKFDDSNKFIT